MARSLHGSNPHERTRWRDELVLRAFGRLDPIALGAAVAVILGVTVFLATIVLVVKGGSSVGPRLGLLAQYFPGYRVTSGGSLVGLTYGLGVGFGLGWLAAVLRNLLLQAYVRVARLESKVSAAHDLIDSP